MKKSIYIFLLCIITIFLIPSISNATEMKVGIESFPDSYKPYLYELKSKYPTWEFTALYTGIDWDYVVSQQYANNKNLVPKSYSDVWKCTIPGIYNVEIDGGWVNASKRAIEYTMDPRNFLNQVRVFQFEKLTYDPLTNIRQGVERILYGTEFYGKIASYKDSSGKTITTDKTYGDYLWDSAIYSGVSPYHLASRMRQEVGPFLSHASISGIVEGFEGFYNFYNIGATSSTTQLGAIKNGLQYSKDGKGASEEIKLNQLIPWNTPEKAIKGGAVFIGSKYILTGQNTLYLQKFHVNGEKGGELFWHQYMTNCLAPYNESISIYNAYNSNDMLSSSIGFLIPVYNNMSTSPIESPNISLVEYTQDDTKVYADVSGNLNIRTGPSTSYEILTTVTRNDVLTRIAKGIQSGERWDKVRLENGLVGYVFQSYLKEIPKPSITNISLSIDVNIINKGKTGKVNIQVTPNDGSLDEIVWESSDDGILTVSGGTVTGISSGKAKVIARTKDNLVRDEIEITIYSPVEEVMLDKNEIQIYVGRESIINVNMMPEDATSKEVIWSTSDPSIATVSQTGLITGISEGKVTIIARAKNETVKDTCIVNIKQIDPNHNVDFDNSITVENDEISKLDLNNLEVLSIKDLITTDLNIKIYNLDNVLLEDSDKVGTGSKLLLIDDEGSQVYTFTFLIYGDLNGDGGINALDVLVLQRHILETKILTDIFLKAGNTSKNGNLPNSLDVLRMQRHILEITFIEQ